MCGIAGILNSEPSREGLADSLASMQENLRHRGPDDEGVWISRDQRAGLVHTRLSILDLSPAGHQPMISPDGQIVICFNGEIYNFRELRMELEQAGAVFATRSDTEVLLHLYMQEGAAMVDRLRGMFAFCIWDERSGEALLARDPFGIKPLYIYEGGGRLAFASELRALCRSSVFAPTLNTLAVRRYFETGSVPEPLTLVREATCLQAGELLVWKDGRSERRTYWKPEFKADQEGDATALTRAALLDSVSHHFVSDVPVGIFLSGGMDSTALLALAGLTGHSGIHACSIAVDDAAADESPLARRTAAHFGADYHEMRLDADMAGGLFQQFLQHLDQPTIDGLNTFTVSSLARREGMKVVLSGLGGDEVFGGYASFERIPKMLRWRKALRLIPGAAAMLERSGPQHRRMAEFVRSGGTVQDAFGALRGIFSRSEASQLTRWVCGDVPDALPVSEQAKPVGADEISRLELTRYMRNQLLRDSDVMSMAHGLELRVPFVDRALFDAVAGIPAAVRIQPNKKLLSDAVPEVPEWIVNQKKRGFLFPYQRWLAGEWGGTFEEAAKGAPVPVPNWYQKWSIFILRHCMKSLGVQPS